MTPKKKNILLITSDQQHWFTIGRLNPQIKTPNLDRLCDQGICFDRAYTVNPTCTPTRASIITGKYPSQHGAWTLGTKLMEKEQTIGDAFINAGYRTALIGKAHFQPLRETDTHSSIEAYPTLQDLAFWGKFSGPFYGFGHIELARNHTNEAHVGQHYALWLEEKGCHNWREYFLPPTGTMERSESTVWNIPEKYHYNTWIAERTNAFINQCSDNHENFFLWASFPDPHPAYLVPEPYASMYNPESLTLRLDTEKNEYGSAFHKISQEKSYDISEYKKSGYFLHGVHSHLYDEQTMRKQAAVYYGMVTMMDKYIGKILNKLDELGLSEDTAVIFTSDHGHFFGQHGLTAKGPFMYEDLIKVPFIVRCPGQKKTGIISNAMQSTVDLTETFLNICDIPLPDGTAGINQKDVWLGLAENVRSWASCEHHHEYGSIHLRTYINKSYKITLYDHIDYGELFDLEKDPNEYNNCWNNPDYSNIKIQLLYEFGLAEMKKEPKYMERIADA